MITITDVRIEVSGLIQDARELGIDTTDWGIERWDVSGRYKLSYRVPGSSHISHEDIGDTSAEAHARVFQMRRGLKLAASFYSNGIKVIAKHMNLESDLAALKEALEAADELPKHTRTCRLCVASIIHHQESKCAKYVKLTKQHLAGIDIIRRTEV